MGYNNYEHLQLSVDSSFLTVLRFSPPIKLTAAILTEILLKVALNTINQPINHFWYFHLERYLGLIPSMAANIQHEPQKENERVFFFQTNLQNENCVTSTSDSQLNFM